MTAEKFGYKYGPYLVVIFILLLVTKYYVGIALPGHFFERGRDYSANVYVLLFPEDSDAKNYRLAGEIHKGESGYGLDKVYWPNGEVLTFSDCPYLSTKSTEWCTPDGSDISYNVQLTQNEVK